MPEHYVVRVDELNMIFALKELKSAEHAQK